MKNLPQKQKLIRIKNLKFDNIDDLHEFYEGNPKEIHLYTLDRLQSYYRKYNKVADIDVYKVDLLEQPEVKYMSVLEDEWEEALFEIESYMVANDLFETATIVRDFSWEIFGKTEL